MVPYYGDTERIECYNTVIEDQVIADDIVTVRAARSGENIPLIFSLPKEIAEVMKLRKGQKLVIYIDGETVRKYEGPRI